MTKIVKTGVHFCLFVILRLRTAHALSFYQQLDRTDWADRFDLVDRVDRVDGRLASHPYDLWLCQAWEPEDDGRECNQQGYGYGIGYEERGDAFENILHT